MASRLCLQWPSDTFVDCCITIDFGGEETGRPWGLRTTENDQILNIINIFITINQMVSVFFDRVWHIASPLVTLRHAHTLG